MTAPKATLDPTQERIMSRPFRTDADYRAVRDLLIATYPITPADWNWEPRRWEGQRFHREDTSIASLLKPGPIQLWEDEAGQLVAVAHHEGGLGHAFLTLHPDYRHLEAAMFDWAEAHLAKINDQGKRDLVSFVYEYDLPRRILLQARGYEKQTWGGVIRRMRLNTRRPIPPVNMAAGYTLRTTNPTLDDGQRVADVLNAAFNRDCHTGKEVYNFFTQAPSFRHDLDLVAVAPDGSFAAYVGVTLETMNMYGTFEPVCTHPDHQRKGLARALMLEGMHRLRALNARDVYVGTGDQFAANRLYEAMGFTEVYKGYGWCKLW